MIAPDNISNQLANGTPVTVAASQNGWLEISQPSVGWVALNLAKVSCGDSLPIVLQNLKHLQTQAMKYNVAASDTLIRYLLRGADGAYAEAAWGTFDYIAQNSPNVLVVALDHHNEATRQTILRRAIRHGMTSQGRTSFNIYLTSERTSPTLKTWQALTQK